MGTAIFPPFKVNEVGVTYPRDASFSLYLNTTERDLVRSLAESINNSPPPVQEISTPLTSSMGRKFSRAQRNGELDVFRAERYFNEIINDKKDGSSLVVLRKNGDGRGINQNRHHRREKRDDLSSRSNMSSASRLKPQTPSIKSEGSFSTQIGLLLPKKGSVGHKIFSGFQCKGSCLDKKSVYTTNTHQMVQSSPSSYQGKGNGYRKSRLPHQGHFAFPIIDTASLHLDQPRKSMEVFGLHQQCNQEIAQNPERKISILSWDAIPNSPTTTTCTISSTKKTSHCPSTARVEDDVDVCSYASSDLFEIDNLLGVPCSNASTPYYAPSEGSIEWSVVTASAVDNFSAFSDHDDHQKFTMPTERSKNITIERRKMQRSATSGGKFLGCASHKAVAVVGNYNQP